MGRRYDLDDVPRLHLVLEGDELAVHLGANATVADIRVHAVSEIDGRGALGEPLDVTLGREHVDFFREQLHPDGIHELLGILKLLLPFQELPEPGETLHVPLVVALAFLVFPVGRNARLGNTVHLGGPYLHFHPLAERADHRGVQRLVHVALGHGDIVLEASGNGLPRRMDDAKDFVTRTYVIDQDADRHEIVNLVDIHVAALHLVVDGVEVLAPPRDVAPDAVLDQLLGNDFHDFPHIALTLLFLHRDL